MTHPSVHARTHPNKIAYQMAATGKAITYRELDELSNQGAHLFRSLGLKAGDHIAFLMENRLAFMEICWAAQRAGLYYTAISRYLTQDEIAYIVKDCGAKVFITTSVPMTRKLPRSRPPQYRTKSPATTCCIRQAPPDAPRASRRHSKEIRSMCRTRS
jgi:acyl-CoA synthetase (AMP-forming)/AMP-acid ligase II